MKNKKLIAYSILAICWEELMGHAITWNNQLPGTHLWMDTENNTVSVIQNGPEYIAQPLYLIRENLLSWILEWLSESKMVILYSCPDNGEIALHRPNDFTEPMYMLDDSDFPELNHILYMAYD